MRHAAVRLGLDRLLLWRRRRRGQVIAHLGGASTAERFRLAYEARAWHEAAEQQSTSGAGSEMPATERLRSQLPVILTQLGCHRLLDVGCGDFHWMRSVDLPCEYVGVDVVPAVIDANRRHARPGIRFEVADATRDALPVADVALCRDVLFHLSRADGRAVLANIRRSARWLLATSDTGIWFNSDIRSGDYRRINLQRAPYELPRPRLVIPDDALSPGRIVGLWAVEDLPAAG